MLIAVLERRAGVRIRNQDVYVNVVGGLRIVDPGADLALCVAIASSARNATVPRKTVFIGEVGLGGEIRSVKAMRQRLLEAARAGFSEAIVPETESIGRITGIKVKQVSRLSKVISELEVRREA